MIVSLSQERRVIPLSGFIPSHLAQDGRDRLCPIRVLQGVLPDDTEVIPPISLRRQAIGLHRGIIIDCLPFRLAEGRKQLIKRLLPLGIADSK